MADTTALKNRIRAAIKANDNQEITGPILQQSLLDIVDELNSGTEAEASTRSNADAILQQNITAEKNRAEGAESTLQQNIATEATIRQQADTQLNNLITGIKNNIDNGYVYAGIATPSTVPVSGKVFYIAKQAGTYTNFGVTTVTEGITILKYNGTSWVKEQVLFIDEQPTAESENLVKSGGVYFKPYNNVSTIDGINYFDGYVASSNNPDYAEGTIAFVDNYVVTNLIELQPGVYRIKSETSINAITIGKFSKQGAFVNALYVGTSEANSVERMLILTEISYIRICSRKNNPIEIMHDDTGYVNGIRTTPGYVASSNNPDYAEGTLVRGDGIGYIITELIRIEPGLYSIRCGGSSLAALISSYTENGMFVETIKAGDANLTYNSYNIYFSTRSYIRVCSSMQLGNYYPISIEPVSYSNLNGIKENSGFIASSQYSLAPEGSIVVEGGYTTTDLIELQKGKYTIRCGGSPSVILIAKYDKYGNYIGPIAVGKDSKEYLKYDITLASTSYIRVCSRTETLPPISIKLKQDDDTIEESLKKDGKILLNELVNWHNGYVASANHSTYEEGTLVTSSGDLAYRYSDIFTLAAGKTYIIGVGCSSAAIAVSKYVNGVFDSALFVPSGVYNSDIITYEYTPSEDTDIRLSRSMAAGDKWFIYTVNDDLYKPLTGKIFNFLGDSYVANHNNSYTLSWEYKMCLRNNSKYRNYGINGNGIVAGTNPMVDRYTSMEDNADYVIVVGGKNDYNNQISISDFKDGLERLINGLINKYVERGTKIAFFTPWKVYLTDSDDARTIKLQQYVDAMIEVCGNYSIPIFDSSRKSSVFMFNSGFRTKYCQASTDISHLNTFGHDYFLPKAESFIKSL